MGNAAQKATSAATKAAVQAAKAQTAMPPSVANAAAEAVEGVSKAARRAALATGVPPSQQQPIASSSNPLPGPAPQHPASVTFEEEGSGSGWLDRARAAAKKAAGHEVPAGAGAAASGEGGSSDGWEASAAQNRARQAASQAKLFSYGDNAPLVPGSAKATEAASGSVAGDAGRKAAESEFSAKPLDPALAEVQQAVAAESDTPSETITVRRLVPSGPAVQDAAILQKIHEKNEDTVRNVMGQQIVVTTDTNSLEARSTEMWQAMQLNPSILDTPQAILASPTARAAIRALAVTGGTQPLALPDPSVYGSRTSAAPGAPGALPLRFPSSTASSTPVDPQQIASNAAADEQQPANALAVINEATLDALVPVDSSLDNILLAHEPVRPLFDPESGKALIVWENRPPETSPYDQLVLHNPEDEKMLHRSELFELFARHKSDPQYWTPVRLAEMYDTKPEWVEVLLQHISPPVYARVDGDVYGVYEIRSVEDFERQHESK